MENTNGKKSAALYVCLVGVACCYLLVLVKIVLLKYGWNPGLRSVNFLPFQFVADFFAHDVSVDVSAKNILGNVAIFIPLGVLAPALFRRVDRFRKAVLIGFAASLLFETLQYVFGLGASDVDDLILNTLGAAAGSGLYFGVFQRFGAEVKTRLASLVFLAAFGAMGFLALWLYAPGELPAVVETVNIEALNGLDADAYAYTGTPTALDAEAFSCENVYATGGETAETSRTWELTPDARLFCRTLSYQLSPNGNIQKTFCTYDRLDAETAAALIETDPHVFADVWTAEDGRCTAVMLTVYAD